MSLGRTWLNFTSEAAPPTRSYISRRAWNTHKKRIIELRNRSVKLSEIRDIVKRESHFDATEAQYKRILQIWGDKRKPRSKKQRRRNANDRSDIGRLSLVPICPRLPAPNTPRTVSSSSSTGGSASIYRLFDRFAKSLLEFFGVTVDYTYEPDSHPRLIIQTPSEKAVEVIVEFFLDEFRRKRSSFPSPEDSKSFDFRSLGSHEPNLHCETGHVHMIMDPAVRGVAASAGDEIVIPPNSLVPHRLASFLTNVIDDIVGENTFFCNAARKIMQNESGHGCRVNAEGICSGIGKKYLFWDNVYLWDDAMGFLDKLPTSVSSNKTTNIDMGIKRLGELLEGLRSVSYRLRSGRSSYNYSGSEEVLSKALQTWRKHSDSGGSFENTAAQLGLAELYVDTFRFDEAWDLIKNILQSESTDPYEVITSIRAKSQFIGRMKLRALDLAATIYLQQGNQDDLAMRITEAVFETAKGTPEFYKEQTRVEMGLGFCQKLISRGFLGKAAAVLTQLTKLDIRPRGNRMPTFDDNHKSWSEHSLCFESLRISLLNNDTSSTLESKMLAHLSELESEEYTSIKTICNAVSLLALFYQNKQDYRSAISYYERCINYRERIHGKENPYTVGVVDYLLPVLSERGLVFYTRPLSLVVLKIFDTFYGPFHPDLLRAIVQAGEISLKAAGWEIYTI